jgi:tape measure domain-containing protein
MAADDIGIRVRLIDAAKAAADAKRVEAGIKGIGSASQLTSRVGSRALDAYTGSVDRAAGGIKRLVSASRYGIAGIGALAGAGVKWGLSFNAQVESARLRFKLFTDDVDGLTKSVQGIDLHSAFNFGDLSDAAAMLGNSGLKDIPNTLQAAANAAAASGKGLPALQGIVIALSQIQAKGRLSQEEINQLNEAGAPGAQKIIQKAFGLTGKQVGNLGAQGLSSKKAIAALTDAWTSGKMAKAASDQTKTLGGQWQLFTGNAQKAAGALTEGLAKDLEKQVLPAANRAAQSIQHIFQNDNLAPEEKLRRARAVIVRELGPFAEDLKDWIDRADIPGHLGDVIGQALPRMASAAAAGAPHVASAFVNAWLHSGPWAQLLSALYIGGKLKGKMGGGGAGGILGGAAKGLLGKGSNPANPLWVAVVNGGAGGLPGTVPTKGPGKVGGKVGGVVNKVGKYVLPVAAGVGALDFGYNVLGPAISPRAPHYGPHYKGKPPIHDNRSADAREQFPIPGAIMPNGQIETTVNVKIGERTVAKAVARTRAKDRARRGGNG